MDSDSSSAPLAALQDELANKDELITAQAKQIEGLQLLVSRYQSELAALKTSDTDIDDHIYENQRWYPPGRWSTELLPTERPSWSNEAGTEERDFDSVKLPDETWQWVGQWIIQQTTNENGESDADSEGWVYGIILNKTIHNEKKWNSTVRRRKWARRRLKVTSTELSDPKTDIQSTVLIATLEQEVMRLMSENKRLNASAESSQEEAERAETGVNEPSNLAKAKANAAAGAESAAANIKAGAGVVGTKISSVRETIQSSGAGEGIRDKLGGASQKLNAFGSFLSSKSKSLSNKVNERVAEYKAKQAEERASSEGQQQPGNQSSSGGGESSSSSSIISQDSSKSSKAAATVDSAKGQALTKKDLKPLLDLGVDEKDLDEL
jgi:hypothetical protein